MLNRLDYANMATVEYEMSEFTGCRAVLKRDKKVSSFMADVHNSNDTAEWSGVATPFCEVEISGKCKFYGHFSHSGRGYANVE